MNKMNSLGNRVVAMLLCIIMVLGMLPVDAIAVEPTAYGSVESFTDGVTISGSGAEIVATYKGTLNWVAKEESIGRNEDGWWVGLKIIAPETVNMEKAQYARGGQKMLFKDHNDSADDAAVQYMGVWGLVKEDYLRSANLTDGLSTYTWTFDWDGDDVFEQKVVLDIVSADVILLGADGSQAYPAASVSYGVVEPLSSGVTVSGSETATATVSFGNNATIAWVEKDESVGRYQDGWWAGMKITAPSGVTAQQLQSVQYKSGNTVKPFWDYKDSKDTDSVHFLTMWIPLNDLLSGKDVSYTYEFDWNNDGLFEQNVVFNVDASKVTLTKNGVQQYPVLGEVTSFNGGSITGSGTGAVTVDIDNVTLDWAPADTSIGRTQGWWVGIKVNAPAGMTREKLENAKYQTKSGPNEAWSADKSFWNNKDSADSDTAHNIQLWIRVPDERLDEFVGRDITMWYQFDWDGNGTYEQSITFSVDPNGVVLNKKAQTDFAYAVDEDVVTYGDNENSYTILVPNGAGQVAGTPVYSVSGNENEVVDNGNGTLTIKKAGEVTITATLKGDRWYNDISDSYVLKINKAEQKLSFAEASVEVTYSENGKYTQAVSGAKGDGVLTYAITAETYNGETADVADFNAATGELTIKQSGAVTVQATKLGDDCYKDAEPVTYTLTVNKANQTGFAVENGTVTYNDNGNVFTPSYSGGQTQGAVTYKVKSGDAVKVENNTIKLVKAGTATIVATKAGDAKYNDTTAEFTVTVNKDTQEFDQAFNAGVSRIYGDTEFAKVAAFADNNNGGKITYAISNDTVGATVDANGKVTLDYSKNRVGSFTVTASAAETECYLPNSISYTVAVSYLQTDATFTVDNVWHTTGSVTVKVPEGYTFSQTGEVNAAWQGEETFLLGDAQNGKVAGYLRDAAGHITDMIELSGIKMDTTEPTDLTITYAEPKGLVKLAGQLFGIYQKDTLKVTVSAKDDISGIAKLIYSYDGVNSNVVTFNNLDEASCSFELPAQYRDQVKLTAVNGAGLGENKTKVDEKIIILDTSNPVVGAQYEIDENVKNREFNDILYSQGKVVVQFTINESNADLSGLDLLNKQGEKTELPVLSVNGAVVEVEKWEFAEGKLTGSYTLEGDGDYKLKLTYNDAAGNALKQDYQKEIRIDSELPEIEILEAQNGAILKADHTATIQITEHNFDAKDVEVVVVAKDIKGDDVTVMDYTAEAKKAAKWVSNGDVHTLELPFAVDAVYTLAVNYTDLADNKAEQKGDSFTVDKTPVAVDDIQISYSTPLIDKMLNTVTFGFYKEKAVITVTAKDMTSGADYVELTYTKSANSSDINKATAFVEKDMVCVDEDHKNEFTVSWELEADADSSFSAVVYDKAGNASGQKTDDDNRIIVDNTNPLIGVTYLAEGNTVATFRDADKNKVADYDSAEQVYYDGKAKAEITINEANFFEGVADDSDNLIHQVAVKITKTDDDGDVTVKEYLPEGAQQLVDGATAESIIWAHNGDDHTAEIPVTEEGDYVLEISYTDLSGNSATYTSKVITVDETDPEIEILEAQNGAILKADHTAKIQITEHNFDAKDVEVVVVAKDIKGDDVTVMDYTAEAKTAAKWVSNGDVHTLELPFAVDAVYTLTVNYTDLADNKAEQKGDSFTVDETEAQNIQFSYSEPIGERIIETLTFGFYKASVEVTVTAEDITSGVDYFELTYTRDEDATSAHTDDFTVKLDAVQSDEDKKVFTASHTVSAQARGSYSVVVYDKAGNDVDGRDPEVVTVVDTEDPVVTVEYAAKAPGTDVRFVDSAIKTVGTFAEATNAFFNGDVVATITVNEANFFEGKTGANNSDIIHEIGIKLTKTDDEGNVTVTEYLPEGAQQLVAGATARNIVWKHNGDEHTAEIIFAEDGDYVLEITYTDFSTNDAKINGNDKTENDIAEKTYVSKVITVDKTLPVIEISYDNNSVENENCYKNVRTATIKVTEHNFKPDEFVVSTTSQNILGGDIVVDDYANMAKNPENWKQTGNEYTLMLSFTEDAIYKLIANYTDLAGNQAEQKDDSFTVDETEAQNIQLSYSKPIGERIIETLTFGFYKASVEVTVTAEDITSGVDYFKLTYTRDKDATSAHTDDFTVELDAVQSDEDKKVFAASHTVPAQARGSYSVVVYDRAGNDSTTSDPKVMTVVDTEDPVITVEYAAKAPGTNVRFVDSAIKTVGTFAEATNAFFNGDVVATITVNEANFFEGKTGANNSDIIHEIGIKLTKTDDEGNVTVTEYLPKGAVQKYAGAEVAEIKWTTEGDVHTAVIPYEDNADYVLQVEYIDLSENKAAIAGNDGKSGTTIYTSKVVTVDKIKPVINVVYGNTEVINTIEGREYLNKEQSAVITVTEHNFRAADVAAVVTAKDVTGADVKVADFAAQLADEESWTHNGNVHTAEVAYTVDANYTFDIDMVDLAQNASADYKEDLFTVDAGKNKAPTNLTVAYNTNVAQRILEAITFGYYKSQVNVTITADDATSGVYHFDYSYINSEGVSEVNKQELNQAIKNAEITYSDDDKTATAEFKIPKEALGRENQFNGTVEFIAYDRSENSTQMKDTTRIVVDNIRPTSTVSFNNPVQSANNISYYGGNIEATININEANFDAKDVRVTVTKDGANYPVNVSWRDNSVDSHTGTFVLTEDGDYFVSVSYTDKSGNEMGDYKSNQLTLDTTAPVIKVSNIKANSANKDEKYGFVIEISDINLNAETMKPSLKAVVKTEGDVYKIEDIDLGKATTVVAGQTYTYTVEDLPEDALYTLTCEVKDMSNNEMKQIVLDDGNSYEQVQFSINRGGSTFGYGAETTEKLVEQYYVYSIDEDVVIVEVNVDPIEEYKVTLNGEELKEGTDYTTEQTSKNGEWSKRTYTIKKELFAAEGEYSIIVSSTDKAKTTAFSDVKNLALSFVVDQSKPVLTITGLAENGRYQTDVQTVVLIPTDEGGRLNNLSVIVLDSNGNPLKDESGKDISIRFEMAGEELLKYLEENDGKVVFTIPQGLNNQVQIICNDCAVNAEGLTNEYNELFARVTVSPSGFVIFYANKFAFFGAIAGVLAVVALIIVLIKRKNSKKEKAKA